MAKTIREINEKIRKGQAVVVTAEEIIDVVEEKGAAKATVGWPDLADRFAAEAASRDV